MPHIIRYLVPGVGAADAAARLANALARSGRALHERRALPVEDEPPVMTVGTLRWAVRSLVLDSGPFLEVDDIGPERWDLDLARNLSAEVDGFVSVLDVYSNIGRYGEALFFAGRTIEARSWGAAEGDIDLGPPLSREELHGVHVGAVYDHRFGLLCDSSGLELRHGKLLASEDWTVAPPTGAFDPSSESGFALILLGNLDPERLAGVDLAAAAPGWRRRVRRSFGLDVPYAELRREGPLDEVLLAALSGQLQCSGAGVEVPGGGRPHRWALAYQGTVEHRGESNSGDSFLRTLNTVAALHAEGPGQLFGLGDGGWEA